MYFKAQIVDILELRAVDLLTALNQAPLVNFAEMISCMFIES